MNNRELSNYIMFAYWTDNRTPREIVRILSAKGYTLTEQQVKEYAYANYSRNKKVQEYISR